MPHVIHVAVGAKHPHPSIAFSPPPPPPLPTLPSPPPPTSSARAECFAMPHVIHVAVGACSLLVFIAIAALFQMAEMELDPLTKSVLAIGHSK